MSEITKLHVLRQLEDHQQCILDSLALLILEFPDFPAQEINNKLIELKSDLSQHFDRSELLIENVRQNPDMKTDLLKYEEGKERIKQCMTDVLAHADDHDGLLAVLKQLAGELRVFSEFEELHLNRKVSRYSSAEELQKAFEQFE